MKLDILQSSKMVEHRTPSSGGRETGFAQGRLHRRKRRRRRTFVSARRGIAWPDRSLQPGPQAATEKWIWNPDGFAREQLRGLVQRIFFSQATARMRQVVISAAESRTDVSDICLQVGETLSQETSASVVVVAGDVSGLPAGCRLVCRGMKSNNRTVHGGVPWRRECTAIYG